MTKFRIIVIAQISIAMWKSGKALIAASGVFSFIILKFPIAKNTKLTANPAIGKITPSTVRNTMAVTKCHMLNPSIQKEVKFMP